MARDKIGRLLDEAAWVDTAYTRARVQGMKKYRLTPREYEQIAHFQDWKCAGCRTQFTADKNIKIDHCHDTGEVRGLLCNSCNIALGWVRDNHRTLQGLAHYLICSRAGRSDNDSPR